MGGSIVFIVISNLELVQHGYRCRCSNRCSLYPEVPYRDIRAGYLIGSYWPQMGQFWDFLRSVIVHFGSQVQNVMELILKIQALSHLVAIWPIFRPNVISMV